MGLYRTYVLPRLLHLSMRQKEIAAQRSRVIPAARGRVLEIGIGSGLNLPYYTHQVDAVIGVDPSTALLAMARKAAREMTIPVEFVTRGAEEMPFDDRSFDTVVSTWSLCTIPGVGEALAEVRRVLKPGGELVFIEHGRAPERRVLAWQDFLNPVWRRCAGGCNLNRPIDRLIAQGGFALTALDTGYLVKGPRPLTYHYRGVAKPM